MPHTPRTHRWIVDGIEEGVARLEADGERIFTLPVSLLPAGVREGQVLAVVWSGSDGSTVLTITIDPAATADALEKSRAQVAKIAKTSRKLDGGGDVSL
jgi:hypothetical protein